MERAAFAPRLPTAGGPLITSRSLGRLLGLESVAFKVECRQPTGSWLDRSAAALGAAAVAECRAGLCTVGVEAWTLPVAVHCASTDLRFVVLDSAESERHDADQRGWLSALGVRTIAVGADLSELQAVASDASARAGLRLVLPDDPLLQLGLASMIQEVEQAGHADAVLALPEVAGWEHRWLASTALMRRRPAVVGRFGEDVVATTVPDDSFVVTRDISTREADAARRLLAREEGLVTSRRGATGFAGLVRALRDDRAKRPRERRFHDVTSAVVVLTGDPLRASDGPPPEPDAVPRRPVTLASLAADLAKLLVEPPGR